MKLFLLVSVLCLGTACGKKDKAPAKTPVSNNSANKETQAADDNPVRDSAGERTKYVRLEIVNRENAIEVRILDKQNKRIENTPFTICLVKYEGSAKLDKSQSATVTGLEFSDTDGDGSVIVNNLDSGSYEVYLRPIETYLDANPVPISVVMYKFDESITEKIKQANEVDAVHEDKSYVEDEKDARKRENAIKVSNLVSGELIKGKSKKFKVKVPELTAEEEIQYEKLNSSEITTSLDVSDYLKPANQVEILIGGEKKKVYVYEESRFDPRVDEYYISQAIVVENGKKMMYNLVPRMTDGEENVYIGWYSKKGKHYYNDDDGYPLTGWKKIDGMWYYFNEDGQKQSITGVDVSEYQKEIDWVALKESGIDFAIIRCGYRGYETGVLVEDAMFRQNIEEATKAGMPFGVYIFSQAITPVEAAEEASMILELCKGYELTLPYAIDIEACGDSEVTGRQNTISPQLRTQVINTFVNVIESQGKEAMLYSNKHWLDNEILMQQIKCKLWYAMWPGEDEDEEGNAPNNDAYEVDPDKVPDRPVEIWQYSSKGQVGGIEELVDLNAWIPSVE